MSEAAPVAGTSGHLILSDGDHALLGQRINAPSVTAAGIRRLAMAKSESPRSERWSARGGRSPAALSRAASARAGSFPGSPARRIPARAELCDRSHE